MTNEINRIGINTGSVNPYGSQPKGGEAKPEENKPEVPKTPAQGAQVNPNDVLNYMAQQAVVVNPKVSTPKTYDVGKYVTPEQAARIAGFVTSFEDQVAEGLLAINEEFGENSPLSEASKYEIAAKMVG
ncbi:MAG: hypothetical protein KHX03_04180 [Clostridium sp.]|nr:hypothetical protein [Clostridium sp.]